MAAAAARPPSPKGSSTGPGRDAANGVSAWGPATAAAEVQPRPPGHVQRCRVRQQRGQYPGALGYPTAAALPLLPDQTLAVTPGASAAATQSAAAAAANPPHAPPDAAAAWRMCSNLPSHSLAGAAAQSRRPRLCRGHQLCRQLCDSNHPYLAPVTRRQCWPRAALTLEPGSILCFACPAPAAPQGSTQLASSSPLTPPSLFRKNLVQSNNQTSCHSDQS